MYNPRFCCGNIPQLGTVMNLDQYVSDMWATKEAKSSIIEVIPLSGIIIKNKKRTLDRTLYEAYATLFFSELLARYSDFLPQDLTLYSPESLKLEYGVEGREDSLDSRLYQFFCPGIPLGRVNNVKARTSKVEGNPVRKAERAIYLAGLFSKILAREGIVHGDPQLRHAFLMPEKVFLPYIDREGRLSTRLSNEGLAVIDCEGARIQGPYSEDVMAEIEKFKGRVYRKFGSLKTVEEFFERGERVLDELSDNVRVTDIANEVAKLKFSQRFPEVPSRVDLENRRVIH